MPKTIEELEQKFNSFMEQAEKDRKDFQLKLDSAKRDADQYKELAEKSEENLRIFRQEKEKADKEFAEREAKARANEINGFVEENVKSGRITPAVKDKLEKFMSGLKADDVVLEFTEKDGSKRSHSQLSLFKEIISSLKPVVPVKKVFSSNGAQVREVPNDGGETPVEQFQEVVQDGVKKKLPMADVDLSVKALEYQEEQKKNGKDVSFEEALIEMSRRKMQEEEEEMSK